MVHHWEVVAAHFGRSATVMGFELMNEPWFGDVYSDPELLLPGVTDRRYLVPLWDRATRAIRARAKDRLGSRCARRCGGPRHRGG